MDGYDLLPRLRRLTIPTLVVGGDADFFPRDTPASIAAAIPGARFELLKDCGHFAYLECAGQVRHILAGFFSR